MQSYQYVNQNQNNNKIIQIDQGYTVGYENQEKNNINFKIFKYQDIQGNLQEFCEFSISNAQRMHITSSTDGIYLSLGFQNQQMNTYYQEQYNNCTIKTQQQQIIEHNKGEIIKIHHTIDSELYFLKKHNNQQMIHTVNLNKCLQKQFFNYHLNQCQNCPKDCQICDSIKCLKCVENSQKCQSKYTQPILCTDIYKNPQTFCTNCIQGFYMNIHLGQCNTCHKKCETCHEYYGELCKTCFQDINRTMNIPNCECKDGYYNDPNYSYCQKCDDSCSKCYYISPKKSQCIECKIKDLNVSQTDVSICECPKYYYKTKKQGISCEKCPDKCEKCQDYTGICLTCKSLEKNDYYNRNNDPPTCSCPEGTFEYGNGVQEICCSVRCAFCTKYSENCLQCGINRYNPPLCGCKKGYKEIGLECIKTECEIETFWYNGICLKCIQNCKVCDNESTCQICSDSNRVPPYCECQKGFYSLTQEKNSECKICNTNAQCPGGMDIQINQGFWRESLLTDEIIECLPNTENCLGGLQIKNSLCKEGYIGPLCQSCDYSGISNNQGDQYYQKDLNGNCSKCSEENYIGRLVFLFISIAFYVCFYYSIIKGYKNQANQQLFTKIQCQTQNLKQSTFTILKYNKKSIATLTKMLLNFLFCIALLHFIKNSREDNQLLNKISKIIFPISNLVQQSECFFLQDGESYKVQNQFWIYLLYLTLIFVTICIIVRLNLVKNKKNNVKIYNKYVYTEKMFTCWNKFKRTFIPVYTLFLILLAPDIVNYLIQASLCRKIGENYYLQAQLTQLCYTDEYYFSILRRILLLKFTKDFKRRQLSMQEDEDEGSPLKIMERRKSMETSPNALINLQFGDDYELKLSPIQEQDEDQEQSTVKSQLNLYSCHKYNNYINSNQDIQLNVIHSNNNLGQDIPESIEIIDNKQLQLIQDQEILKLKKENNLPKIKGTPDTFMLEKSDENNIKLSNFQLEKKQPKNFLDSCSDIDELEINLSQPYSYGDQNIQNDFDDFNNKNKNNQQFQQKQQQLQQQIMITDPQTPQNLLLNKNNNNQQQIQQQQQFQNGNNNNTYTNDIINDQSYNQKNQYLSNSNSSNIKVQHAQQLLNQVRNQDSVFILDKSEMLASDGKGTIEQIIQKKNSGDEIKTDQLLMYNSSKLYRNNSQKNSMSSSYSFNQNIQQQQCQNCKCIVNMQSSLQFQKQQQHMFSSNKNKILENKQIQQQLNKQNNYSQFQQNNNNDNIQYPNNQFKSMNSSSSYNKKNQQNVMMFSNQYKNKSQNKQNQTQKMNLSSDLYQSLKNNNIQLQQNINNNIINQQKNQDEQAIIQKKQKLNQIIYSKNQNYQQSYNTMSSSTPETFSDSNYLKFKNSRKQSICLGQNDVKTLNNDQNYNNNNSISNINMSKQEDDIQNLLQIYNQKQQDNKLKSNNTINTNNSQSSQDDYLSDNDQKTQREKLYNYTSSSNIQDQKQNKNNVDNYNMIQKQEEKEIQYALIKSMAEIKRKNSLLVQQDKLKKRNSVQEKQRKCSILENIKNNNHLIITPKKK